MIKVYNDQIAELSPPNGASNPDIAELVNYDDRRIKWDRELLKFGRRRQVLSFSEERLYKSVYRPFTKQWLYFSKDLNNTVYQMPRLFPTSHARNLIMHVSGIGISKTFSLLMTDHLPDVQMMPNGQAFPLFWV